MKAIHGPLVAAVLIVLPAAAVPPLPDSGPAPAPAPRLPAREMPPAGERRACLGELARLGATFRAEPAMDHPGGCSVANPVRVENFGGGVDVDPPPLFDCPMALATARFLRDVVAPRAQEAFGAELKGVSQVSAFVCRARNATGRPSEHAFANAIDISAFVLSGDRRVEVKPAADLDEARFLGFVRAAACGPFRTVLGPGSDADHVTHFHFDLQPRRGGASHCR